MKPIYLVTDASLIGTGTWVGQGPNRNEVTLALLHASKFNPAQENSAIFNKELLAIVDALAHFRSVLTGCKFTVLTDHKALEAFPKQYDLIVSRPHASRYSINVIVL